MSASLQIREFEEEQSPFQALHGPFIPAEVRKGEQISATVKSRDPRHPFSSEMQVWKMSPLGVELKVNSEKEMLPKGFPVDLDLTIGTQVITIKGLVVDYICPRVNENRIGIRTVQVPTGDEYNGIDRRKTRRWLCAPQFLPTGVAPNPAKFNDFVYFRICDVSATGFQLLTSLRNKFIVVGMRLDCMISFPMVAQLHAVLRVENVRITMEQGTEQLAVGVTIEDLTPELKQSIGQYLMQFGSGTSLKEMSESGLETPRVSKAVDYTFVKTEEEFQETLELRRQSYVHEGKISQQTGASDLTDIYDTRSRIVIGRYQGKIICTARLTFNEIDEKMEQEENMDWSTDLPRRDRIVEIMRACTHPEYRGSDLLMGMFQFIALTVVQSRRPWIVINTTEKMESLYNKIGFSSTGHSYNVEMFGNLEHKVMIANVPAAMSGLNVNPIVWNLVWEDVSRYMENYGLLKPDSFRKVRMGAYRLLAPIAKLVHRHWLKPRKCRNKIEPQKSSHGNQ